MLVKSISLYRVAMPLVYPFRTAFGNEEYIESVLVRLDDGQNCGWGESAPWHYPAYSSECGSSVFMIVRDFLAPLVLGRDICSGEQLQEILSGIKGNNFAKAALDLAWWDLYAKSMAKPLWRVIGGLTQEADAGADIGVMETIDQLLAEIEAAIEAGATRIKLKYRPGWDLEMIAAVRNTFPDTVFHVDCNSAYTLDDIEMFKKLDKYNLAMIEQPLMHDDLIDHAKLQNEIGTPICLDESITSVSKARKAIEIKACKWVNIKHGRVGGITNALAVHDLCYAAGIPCWIGSMAESAIGMSFCVALATLPNIKYPSDIFPSKRFYVLDMCNPQIEFSSPAKIKASAQNGIGAQPDVDQLQKCLIESVTLSN